MSDYTSEYMALAAAATTSPGQTPRYGLSYDLATGQWVDAAAFREFVRSVLPATQTAAKQQADQIKTQSLHSRELERASNYQDHGLFVTRDELGVDKEGVGNQIMTGFKAIKGYGGNLFNHIASGGNKEDSDRLELAKKGSLYKQYAAKGGLLTEAEFNSFNPGTQVALLEKGSLGHFGAEIMDIPGAKPAAAVLNAGYRGLITGLEMAPHPLEYGSQDRWAQAWREAQGESLGNAIVNLALDPFVSDETLDRWKRENPWYQMTSAGTEFVAAWYADPAVLATKSVGAAARVTRKEMPLNESGAYGRGLAQTLQREQVTVRNPITKTIVNAQANRMNAGWKNIEDYALATSAPEFARTLPMFASRYRAVDGGAGAFALHWAYNNRKAANALLNSQRVRTSLDDVASEFDFELPDTLDVADMTQQLLLGDPKAYAVLTKLHEVAPDELAQIAPGSGTLLSATDALTTKASVLQSEVDDLLEEAKRIDQGQSGNRALPMFHRWEVHTSLADRQRQLADVTDSLQKYNGYSDWLNLLTVKADPRVSRVASPTRQRWSEVRKRDAEEGEQRALFMDNQFSHAHSYYKMPKGLFLKKANAAELDMAAGINSGMSTIERTFDQLENYFGYKPNAGVRDTTIESYVRANNSYDRYKIMHDLEEEHVVGAIATKFKISGETARALVHKIYDERNRTINGVLTGQGQVYRSAPTIMQRLKSGEDSSLQLVSRNEDTGTVTLHMIDGRHKQTFEVPEAALQPRVAPEDVTQTPNYYNPLDHRRLYYKIKHDARLLEEIDAGVVAKSQAALADLGELVGTRFNEFWKPVQLFRLGWPMRVLMDEGARATSIYGPMYWLTGPGAEAVYQSGRNVLPAVADFISRKRKGPLGVDMLGKGTVERAVKSSGNQFVRDYEVTHAVQLPQSMWDKVNPDRLEQIRGHVVTHADWKRELNKHLAWRKEALKSGDLEGVTAKAQRFGVDLNTPFSVPEPEHPLTRIKNQWKAEDGISVFDPVNGRGLRQGYVVPASPANLQIGGDAKDLMTWYEQNTELLSRSGMRLVVDAEGNLAIGRTFRSNEFTKARQYAEYVSEQYPSVEGYDLGNKRSFRVETPDADSPIVQAMYKRFADQDVDGVDVEHIAGNGLYTAVQRGGVENPSDFYAVRHGNRKGKVFNLDETITPAQARNLGHDSFAGQTWTSLLTQSDDEIRSLVVRHLEHDHGALALTHRSGGNQIYTWLRPESTKVKAHGDNSFRSLPEWFSHPRSTERPVLEARERAERAAGELRAQEVEADSLGSALDNFDLEADSPTSWLFRKIHERHEMGKTWKTVTSSDGKKMHVEAAFAGHKGELFRGLTSSNGALDVLSEGHGHGTSMFRRQSEGFRTYSPPEFTDKALKDPKSIDHKKAVLYFQRYADTINDHLGNSPIVQRMIKGESDERIVNWLDTTPEGQRILAEVKPVDMPTGIWVDDHRHKLNYYVPSKKVQRLLGKGRVDPSDFRRNIADEDLPVIYGADFEVLDRRRGAGQFLSDVADKMWTGLGSIPIDALSRHPFAKAAYDTKIRALVGRTNSKWLTDKMLTQYQHEAHKFALEQTRRHLYNLTESTNFNDALRFIAPFWGAQYEAIQKWLRIISDRPETVARFFAGQRAVYENFVVIDEEGNRVNSGSRAGGLHGLGLYHPTDMVVMQIPKSIQKRFGLEGIGSTRIPIGSANTVLQGDLPLLPSLGPLVTIPADQFLRKVSDTYGVENDQNLLYRWLFPIGRPRSKNAFGQMMDQFSPGWINRVRASQSSEDNLSRINMEMLIGREMLFKARKDGKPDPTPEEIKKAADHLWHVRTISSLIQPFQVQYMPDHQYWIDAAHRYQKEFGSKWWDKFIDKYGEEAAIFATSSSNSIGVPPTAKGMEEWSKNKTLIAKYPTWTSAIISPQAYMGDFSSDAYGQQFNINLGPGDTRTLRSGTSLQDRLINDPETQLGWREYRKLDAAVEAELAARGLTNIQQKGAEDLAEIKRYGVSQIMQKYHPWARAYQVQSDQIYSDVEELKDWVFDKAFDSRPDVKGVRQYLIVRQQVTDLLDQAAVDGGSRSLQSQENGALRDWFYNQVGQLVLDNPSFAEFYSRYLTSDTLTLGGGGF